MLQSWQVSLGSRISRDHPGPLYMQIIKAVIRDIEGGRLLSGTYLPSSRELAAQLGVNRKTVVLAYEDLIAQGWLTTSGTRGTRVAETLPEGNRSAQSADSRSLMGQVGFDFQSPPERPIALPEGDGLKIDEGAPDGRLFPAELLVRAYRSAVNDLSKSNGLQYREPKGLASLRHAVSEMLRIQRGLAAEERNICITRGSQNGLFLAAMALIKKNETAVVENLTYEPAVAAFRAAGANIETVRVDEGGMVIDDLERLCRTCRIKAVFTTPHHQFPTTVALKPERRLKLIELARKYGFAIIEDDYDHEFRFETQPLLPLAAYAPDQVIYLGSLSKLLLPSLRIGYIAAPARFIDAISHYVSIVDVMGNSITEEAINILIENGELRRHARKVKQVYAERRNNFARHLTDSLGGAARFSIPAGGLAFWLRFTGEPNKIERRARALGLRFAGGQSYRAQEDAPHGLRLGFASLNAEEARAAIELLRKAAT